MSSGLPKRFSDRDEVAAVLAAAKPLDAGENGEQAMRVAGRVLARRDMGKLVFLDLVDRSGRIQLFCQEDRAGVVDVALGDIVGASGSPMKTKRGEPSRAVAELVLRAKKPRPRPDT